MSFSFPKGTQQMIDSGQRILRDVEAGNATAGSMIDEAVNVGLGFTPPQYAVPIQTAVGVAKKVQAAKNQTQSTKQQTKQSQKQKQKGKQTSSNGKGYGKPNYNETTNSPSQRGNSAYGKVSEGSRVTLSSAMDNSTYKIPSKIQDQTSTEQNVRTWAQIIEILPSDINDYDDNPQIKVAFESIYYHIRSSVVSNTRGGTGSTKDNLTKVKFSNYLDHVMSGYAMLAEYYSIRTLNPHGDETNTVLSSIKDALNGSSECMASAYRLDTLISELSLPPQTAEYYKFLFQTYKKSPVNGGVHQRFMSAHMAEDLNGNDLTFAETQSAMDSVSDFISSNEYFPTIHSLLTQMSDYPWMQLDKIKSGSCEIEYDYTANAILDNSPIQYTSSGTPIRINCELGLTADDNNMLAAFPMDKNSVPIHVTSALLLSFGTSTTYCGFPFFKTSTGPNLTYLSNGMIIQNNANNSTGISFSPVYSAKRQINDSNWLLDNNTGIFLPRGLNTQQFALNYTSLSDATQEFVLDMFGINR